MSHKKYFGNCTQCVYFKSEMHAESSKMRHTCLNNNTNTLHEWWEKHKDIPSHNVVDDIDCYEPTEHTIRLDRLLNLTEQLIEKIK